MRKEPNDWGWKGAGNNLPWGVHMLYPGKRSGRIAASSMHILE